MVTISRPTEWGNSFVNTLDEKCFSTPFRGFRTFRAEVCVKSCLFVFCHFFLFVSAPNYSVKHFILQGLKNSSSWKRSERDYSSLLLLFFKSICYNQFSVLSRSNRLLANMGIKNTQNCIWGCKQSIKYKIICIKISKSWATTADVSTNCELLYIYNGYSVFWVFLKMATAGHSSQARKLRAVTGTFEAERGEERGALVMNEWLGRHRWSYIKTRPFPASSTSSLSRCCFCCCCRVFSCVCFFLRLLPNLNDKKKGGKKSLRFAWVLLLALYPLGSGSWRSRSQLQSLKQLVYSRRFVWPASQRPGGLMWTVAQSHGGGRWHQPEVDWDTSHSSAWGCISFAGQGGGTGLQIVAEAGTLTGGCCALDILLPPWILFWIPWQNNHAMMP